MSQTIALTEGEYWKLLKLSTDLELAKQKAFQMVTAAKEAHAAHLEVLAQAHPGFVPADARYEADDATCSLTRKG